MTGWGIFTQAKPPNIQLKALEDAIVAGDRARDGGSGAVTLHDLLGQ